MFNKEAIEITAAHSPAHHPSADGLRQRLAAKHLAARTMKNNELSLDDSKSKSSLKYISVGSLVCVNLVDSYI